MIGCSVLSSEESASRTAAAAAHPRPPPHACNTHDTRATRVTTTRQASRPSAHTKVVRSLLVDLPTPPASSPVAVARRAFVARTPSPACLIPPAWAALNPPARRCRDQRTTRPLPAWRRARPRLPPALMPTLACACRRCRSRAATPPLRAPPLLPPPQSHRRPHRLDRLPPSLSR